MKMAGDQKSERGLRGILPFMTSFILVLLMQIQYKISVLDNLFPYLSLMGVYYWCIFKPRLMPVSIVFLLGVLQDILSGGPLGMSALLLILVRIFVIRQGRRFLEREFLFNWLVFIIVAASFAFLNWAVASIYLKETQNLWNSGAQAVLTIALYPVIAWFLGLVRNMLISENR